MAPVADAVARGAKLSKSSGVSFAQAKAPRNALRTPSSAVGAGTKPNVPAMRASCSFADLKSRPTIWA